MALDNNGIWWWHSLALPDGSVTPGEKSQDQLQAEWNAMALPDLRGKTVLDIGAWDGWFSFQAEKSGAARVVALDHFVWSLDLSKTPEQVAHRERCTAAGLDYVPWGPDSRYWDSVNLPVVPLIEYGNFRRGNYCRIWSFSLHEWRTCFGIDIGPDTSRTGL